MTGEITTFFRTDSTRISQAQLASSRIIGIIGIIVAYFIFRKQVKLSKGQEDISNRQIELLTYIHNVETARHSIDILADNLNTVLLQMLNANVCKYLDKDQEEVDEFTRGVKSLDANFKVVKETIDEAIDEYTKTRSELPKRASWEYKKGK